jgi:transposase
MELSVRRQRFDKIKKTIRESSDYLLIGVDIAKNSHKACIALSSGKILNKSFHVENTIDGFKNLLKQIKDYTHALKATEVIVGLESTGNFMTPLAHYLENNGIYVVLVSSMVAKRNRDTLTLSWDKNDVKDALNIVDCMRQSKMHYYRCKESPYGDLKRLMHIYSRLSHERGLYKVRLQNNVLCITFPEFTKIYGVVDELVPMTLLYKYPLPQDICSLPESAFIEDIVKNTDPTIKKTKLSALYTLAGESIGSREDTESLRWETRFIIEEIRHIQSKQKELLDKVKRLLVQCREYDLLQTIPGVGPIVAASMLAEIGNINNFKSNRQILKLAGLDLATLQSGKYTGNTTISRRGCPSLRSAAYQAALVAARHDSSLRMKFYSLIEKKNIQKGQKKKILVALACKILRISYAVMKNKAPYQNFYNMGTDKNLDRVST